MLCDGLVLAPKKKREQPRDKLKRLLSRNTAERRGESMLASKDSKSERPLPQPTLGASSSLKGGSEGGGALLQVKRTIASFLATDAEVLPRRKADLMNILPSCNKRKCKFKLEQLRMMSMLRHCNGTCH